MKKSPYSAGELNQRVTLRKEVKSDDGMGGNTSSWQDIATVWAKVRPMTGNEREHSDRLNAAANYLILIRDRSDVDENCVVTWKGTTFNIRFAKVDPRSRFLALECEKGVAV
ncbi:MAG: phage head closure protein [Pigmentiphaga sp.]